MKTPTSAPAQSQGVDAGRKIVGHPQSARSGATAATGKHFVGHAVTLGIDMEIVQRTPGSGEFPPY
ncbi:hypothetical protein [Streptomyces roseochromogenus]|uniref:Uncharacterized protein n=1 Tax=Streptomyces roseochromogenus subsp. oscitans DS 12.976 TaxID=1352936 RepID=V6JH42_STRRC|nr:hypothetical protein [Streptomyces roseochromogenus]EST19197.1 hypothetical protein M878_42690 [Streptomyces roseochromogenus subsp. oscitans DS 12.976]